MARSSIYKRQSIGWTDLYFADATVRSEALLGIMHSIKDAVVVGEVRMRAKGAGVLDIIIEVYPA